MLQRIVSLALTLTITGMSSSSDAAGTPYAQAGQSWQRTDTRRFEIHYVAALAPEIPRVVTSAERAYDRISGRLDFVLAAKVPLVVFGPSGPISREQVDMTDRVAPRVPHRNRMTITLIDDDAGFDALVLHELTHVLVGEMIRPGLGGDSGLPAWAREGVAEYMAGVWRGDNERLLRDIVRSGDVPALSQLRGDGLFANTRMNYALGHAAFDYIESRWGSPSIRRFLHALLIPPVGKAYEDVFQLTAAEFDAEFRQYAEQRFGTAVR